MPVKVGLAKAIDYFRQVCLRWYGGNDNVFSFWLAHVCVCVARAHRVWRIMSDVCMVHGTWSMMCDMRFMVYG
ncbi:hypothetical protein EON63_03420 [archaeon]|nr:MAG: hypothetical protein EON63_03420 [archaeon]